MAFRSIDPATLIPGSGEMSDRIRDLDWSRTPLGPMHTWSEGLITSVNIMLCAPIPMQIFWGPDLILLYNDALIPAFSDKHPNALGQSARVVWAEAWAIVGSQLEHVLNHGEAASYKDVLVPLLQNSVLRDTWWDYAYSPIHDAHGQVAGILNVAQDVTAVHLDRHRLTQIQNATTDAILTINRDWCITYLNGPAVTALGPDAEDARGQNFWELFPLARYDGSPFEEHYNLAMDHQVSAKFEAFYPDPLNIWVKVRVSPTPEGIILFFRDITEDKRVMAALLQNEKLAAVGRMASSIAHEINNPLESVTNLIYIARHTLDPSEINPLLDTADHELRRVANIVNQTLRFHKQSTLPQEITCLNLFTTVLDMFQSRLRNSGVTVLKRKRANKTVEIYEGDIRQVLNNIIGNSIDAMPHGGHVLVRSAEATDWRTGRAGLRLTIADTGSGMDPETRKRLFEAFYTTKGIGGTGLGMWVSAEIMERHSGSIHVRSSQHPAHHGTVIALFLPFEGTKIPSITGLPLLPLRLNRFPSNTNLVNLRKRSVVEGPACPRPLHNFAPSGPNPGPS